MRSGATDYVLKGRLEALAPAVERALAERGALREQIRLETDLVAANAAMSDSESLLRGSLDAMIDPFLIASSIRGADDAITGFRVRFANRAAAAFMGRAARQPGRPTGARRDAVPGRDPVRRGFPHRRGRRRGVDGGWRGVRDPGLRRLAPARAGQHPGGENRRRPARDVAGRDRASIASAVSASASARRLEQTSDGVLEVNADGIITYANPAFLADRGLFARRGRRHECRRGRVVAARAR